MITVGAVVGGPECAFFEDKLRRLMKYCADFTSSGEKPLEVNIVYYLPGSIYKAPQVGLRAAKFSSKEKTIMIQVSVEPEIIQLADENRVLHYIFETVDEAIGLAKSEFAKRGFDYNLEEDRRFLDTWRDSERIK